MCSPIPLHAPVRMRRGRGEGVGRRERVEESGRWWLSLLYFFPRTPPSKRGRRLLTCCFPLFVFIFTFKYH